MKRLFPARGTRGARRWNYCPVHPIVNGLMYPSRHIDVAQADLKVRLYDRTRTTNVEADLSASAKAAADPP